MDNFGPLSAWLHNRLLPVSRIVVTGIAASRGEPGGARLSLRCPVPDVGHAKGDDQANPDALFLKPTEDPANYPHS